MTKRLAIVQRQTLHTEVMGAISSLAHELGYEVSFFYNICDKYEMVSYFSQIRQPFLKGKEVLHWEHLFTRPVDFYDKIVLATSDEWNVMTMLPVSPYINEWNSKGKLIVIHHDELYLTWYSQYKKYLAFSNFYGPSHYIFPLYSGVKESPVITERHSFTGSLPTLSCIGSISSKNLEDVGRWIDSGGSVNHYVRDPLTHMVQKYGEKGFRTISGLNSSELMERLQKDIGNGRGFCWFPVLPESNYARSKFTGSLALAVDVSAILVMPETVQKMIGFWISEAETEAKTDRTSGEATCSNPSCIVYKTSVLEVVEKIIDACQNPEPYVKGLFEWKKMMWESNLKVFKSYMVE
jgi:hypothetical protein